MVAATQIKKRNPNISIAVWYDSVRVYQQNKTLNPDITKSCETGNFEAGQFLDSHPTPRLPRLYHDLPGSKRAYGRDTLKSR